MSFYLVYRVNGKTSTLVEKWQKKYSFEVSKDDLLVEKRTKPVIEKRQVYDYAESQRQPNPYSLHSPWLWTAFILSIRNLIVNLTYVIYYPIDESNPLAGLGWFMYFIMMTPLIIIPTIMLPNAIRIASKTRLYIVAALFMCSRTSIEQLIVPALILYGVSQIKEE